MKQLSKIVILGITATIAVSSIAVGQFNAGSFIGSVTSGIVAGAISEAISQNITEILHAKPVIDMDKVSKVHDVAVDTDAGRMVTALEDGTVRLWSLDEGRELARLEGHDGKTTDITVSKVAGTVASLGEDGEVQVWELDSGKKVARYTHESKALSVVLSASGAFSVTGHEDGSVRVLDAATGDEQARFEAVADSILALALGADDEILIAASRGGNLSAWNLKSHKQVFSVAAHSGPVLSLTVSEDGTKIVSGGEDGRVRVTDFTTGDVLTNIKASGDPIQSVAIADGGKQLAAAGDDGLVRVFDTDSGDEIYTFEGHGDAITSVAYGKKDKVVHTASLDGTSRVFDLESGAEMAQAVSTKDGWAVYNMDGEFDGAGDGLEAVAWTAKEHKFDLDQFAESHYEPGLLSRASEAEKEEKPETRPNLSVKFATPPIVAFSTPEEDTESDAKEYEITAQAGDLGGGVIEMRLFQNGRLVITKAIEETDEKEFNEEFKVKLLTGENRFRLVALSRDRIESRPAKVTVTYTGEELRSNLHVVTIGINEYRNPALNLNYGVPDAAGIREFFETQPRRIFDGIKFYSLENRKATRAGIKELITSLTNTKPDDVVIIYYAGHGTTVEKDWYLIPADLVYPERDDVVRKMGIKSEELQDWVKGITANKVVVFMDACKSGAALKAFRGFGERKALARLARSSGVHIVAAAAKNQFAVELKQLGHGAFTYALLDGLKGEADYVKDKVINIRELMTYIENRLPDLSEEVAGSPQFPVVNSRGGDFPIAVN